MSEKAQTNPLKSVLKDIVDDFFDVAADSDDFKEKLIKDIMKKSKFMQKLAKELNKIKKTVKNSDFDD